MNLGDHAGGLKFLIQDRDTKYTAAFDAVLAAAGIRIIKIITTSIAPAGHCSRPRLTGVRSHPLWAQMSVFCAAISLVD